MPQLEHLEDADDEERLAAALAELAVSATADEPPSSLPSNCVPSQQAPPPPLLVLCDLGYGVPKEDRPRRERVLAIARQLVNFLDWQHEAASDRRVSPGRLLLAQLKLVACRDDGLQAALLERMTELWRKSHADRPFPSNLTFTDRPLQSYMNEHGGGDGNGIAEADEAAAAAGRPVYLSPDAAAALDAAGPPPPAAVVGMLIDRRVRPGRSRGRADQLGVPSRRWPVLPGLDAREPLNVDCILEGLQQWHWNYYSDGDGDGDAAADGRTERSTSFTRAALQAWRHHQARHPQRPTHA